MSKSYRQLREEFMDFFRLRFGLTEVYLNPTPKEVEIMLDANSQDDQIRLLVHKSPRVSHGDVYAWAADQSLHYDVAEELGFEIYSIDDLDDYERVEVIPMSFDDGLGTLHYSDLVGRSYEMEHVSDELYRNSNLKQAFGNFTIDEDERLYARV